ncbi:hypothetical protein DIPPA_21558 [Diplonema papillatum]|nr:hypothetical protein DIPPA_21558 [Diplonema papillatum]
MAVLLPEDPDAGDDATHIPLGELEGAGRRASAAARSVAEWESECAEDGDDVEFSAYGEQRAGRRQGRTTASIALVGEATRGRLQGLTRGNATLREATAWEQPRQSVNLRDARLSVDKAPLLKRLVLGLVYQRLDVILLTAAANSRRPPGLTLGQAEEQLESIENCSLAARGRVRSWPAAAPAQGGGADAEATPPVLAVAREAAPPPPWRVCAGDLLRARVALVDGELSVMATTAGWVVLAGANNLERPVNAGLGEGAVDAAGVEGFFDAKSTSSPFYPSLPVVLSASARAARKTGGGSRRSGSRRPTTTRPPTAIDEFSFLPVVLYDYSAAVRQRAGGAKDWWRQPAEREPAPDDDPPADRESSCCLSETSRPSNRGSQQLREGDATAKAVEAAGVEGFFDAKSASSPFYPSLPVVLYDYSAAVRQRAGGAKDWWRQPAEREPAPDDDPPADRESSCCLSETSRPSNRGSQQLREGDATAKAVRYLRVGRGQPGFRVSRSVSCAKRLSRAQQQQQQQQQQQLEHGDLPSHPSFLASPSSPAKSPPRIPSMRCKGSGEIAKSDSAAAGKAPSSLQSFNERDRARREDIAGLRRRMASPARLSLAGSSSGSTDEAPAPPARRRPARARKKRTPPGQAHGGEERPETTTATTPRRRRKLAADAPGAALQPPPAASLRPSSAGTPGGTEAGSVRSFGAARRCSDLPASPASGKRQGSGGGGPRTESDTGGGAQGDHRTTVANVMRRPALSARNWGSVHHARAAGAMRSLIIDELLTVGNPDEDVPGESAIEPSRRNGPKGDLSFIGAPYCPRVASLAGTANRQWVGFLRPEAGPARTLFALRCLHGSDLRIKANADLLLEAGALPLVAALLADDAADVKIRHCAALVLFTIVQDTAAAVRTFQTVAPAIAHAVKATAARVAAQLQACGEAAPAQTAGQGPRRDGPCTQTHTHARPLPQDTPAVRSQSFARLAKDAAAMPVLTPPAAAAASGGGAAADQQLLAVLSFAAASLALSVRRCGDAFAGAGLALAAGCVFKRQPTAACKRQAPPGLKPSGGSCCHQLSDEATLGVLVLTRSLLRGRRPAVVRAARDQTHPSTTAATCHPPPTAAEALEHLKRRVETEAAQHPPPTPGGVVVALGGSRGSSSSSEGDGWKSGGKVTVEMPGCLVGAVLKRFLTAAARDEELQAAAAVIAELGSGSAAAVQEFVAQGAVERVDARLADVMRRLGDTDDSTVELILTVALNGREPSGLASQQSGRKRLRLTADACRAVQRHMSLVVDPTKRRQSLELVRRASRFHGHVRTLTLLLLALDSLAACHTAAEPPAVSPDTVTGLAQLLATLSTTILGSPPSPDHPEASVFERPPASPKSPVESAFPVPSLPPSCGDQAGPPDGGSRGAVGRLSAFDRANGGPSGNTALAVDPPTPPAAAHRPAVPRSSPKPAPVPTTPVAFPGSSDPAPPTTTTSTPTPPREPGRGGRHRRRSTPLSAGGGLPAATAAGQDPGGQPPPGYAGGVGSLGFGVDPVCKGQGVDGVGSLGFGVDPVCKGQGVDGVGSRGFGVDPVCKAQGVDGVGSLGFGVDPGCKGQGVHGFDANPGVDGVGSLGFGVDPVCKGHGDNAPPGGGGCLGEGQPGRPPNARLCAVFARVAALAAAPDGALCPGLDPKAPVLLLLAALLQALARLVTVPLPSGGRGLGAARLCQDTALLSTVVSLLGIGGGGGGRGAGLAPLFLQVRCCAAGFLSKTARPHLVCKGFSGYRPHLLGRVPAFFACLSAATEPCAASPVLSLVKKLARLDADTRSLCLRSGNLLTIWAALRSPHLRIRPAAAACLRVLLYPGDVSSEARVRLDSDVHAAAFLSCLHGELRLLIGLLNPDHALNRLSVVRDYAAVQISVCELIACVAHFRDGDVLLTAGGLLPALLGLCRSGNSRLTVVACHCIWLLADHSPEEVVESGAISLLSTLVCQGNPRADRYMCFAFESLATLYEASHAVFIQCKVIQPLVHLLGSHDVSVQESAAKTLSTIRRGQMPQSVRQRKKKGKPP